MDLETTLEKEEQEKPKVKRVRKKKETEEPKVESEVFIERGGTVIFAKHGRMAEINNLTQLEKYGNGLYKINKV
jgi:hypothetical protein